MKTEARQEKNSLNGATENSAADKDYRVKFEYNMRLLEEASKFPYGTEEAVFEERCPMCGSVVRYKKSYTYWGFRCDTPDCFCSEFFGL